MSWGLVAAAVIGAGASIYSSKKGEKAAGKAPEIGYTELPGYKESDTAREEISSKLKGWGEKPGYGAISPDWADVWDRARSKVSRYYGGGPAGPGLASKVKASAARRGVSESPALETTLSRMGIQEGIQLGDMATEQALQEALFGEKGRGDWMTNMFRMAGMKPAYATSTGVAQGFGPSMGETVGEAGSALGTMLQQKGQNKWMEQLTNLNQYGGYGGMPGTTGDVSSYLGAVNSGATPAPRPVPASYYS